MGKLADNLDRLRLVPRTIALALAGTAIYLSIRIVDAIIADGVTGVAEVSAVSGLLIAMLTSSTSLVALLGRSEAERNGKD